MTSYQLRKKSMTLLSQTGLDFNFVKPYFNLLQFIHDYKTRFCNLNLDMKSIRQKDRQTKTETDRQKKTERQIQTDRHLSTQTDRQSD